MKKDEIRKNSVFLSNIFLSLLYPLFTINFSGERNNETEKRRIREAVKAIGIWMIPYVSKRKPPDKTAKINPTEPHNLSFPYLPISPLVFLMARDSAIGICPLRKKLTAQRIKKRFKNDQ